MEQLIQITSIPIQMEVRFQNATTEINTRPPSYNLTRQEGKLTINHSYPKLNIDTYEARVSMGLKSEPESVREYGANGIAAAYQATFEITREGNMLADISKNNDAITKIARAHTLDRTDVELAFLPSVAAQISWEPAQLNLNGTADKLTFNWQTHSKPEITYTPADVVCRITQYPDVEIKYLGGPNYIPPSADPNYDPETDPNVLLNVTV